MTTGSPGFDLSASVADVWCVPTPRFDYQALYQGWSHYLSEDEQQRLRQQRVAKGRYTFLLTRLALRQLLSGYHPDVDPVAWRFDRSPEGRPFVSGPVADAPSFNLSHANDMLFIAFSRAGDVGVDIEHLSREVPYAALARRYFSVPEASALAELSAAEQQQRFLILWTLKEACVKASGEGLARALRQFSFVLGEPPTLLLETAANDQRPDCWRLWSSVIEDYRLALAIRLDERQQYKPLTAGPRMWRLNWPDQHEELSWQLHCHYNYSGH